VSEGKSPFHFFLNSTLPGFFPTHPKEQPPFIYGLWLTKWFSELKVDALDLEMEGMLLYEL
jgi:hypothetical protein